MKVDEATEFGRMVSETWQPELTDMQLELWCNLVLDLDARVAFRVLTRLFKTDTFRPSPPEFMETYRAELRDHTPVAPEQPSDRDEMPGWVMGWMIARSEGDLRLWPEQRDGYRALHEAYMMEVGPKFAKANGLKSGYEWDVSLVMPQADRIEYMRRARDGVAQPGGLAGVVMRARDRASGDTPPPASPGPEPQPQPGATT